MKKKNRYKRKKTREVCWSNTKLKGYYTSIHWNSASSHSKSTWLTKSKKRLSTCSNSARPSSNSKSRRRKNRKRRKESSARGRWKKKRTGHSRKKNKGKQRYSKCSISKHWNSGASKPRRRCFTRDFSDTWAVASANGKMRSRSSCSRTRLWASTCSNFASTTGRAT